jgi:hypothetical protein
MAIVGFCLKLNLLTGQAYETKYNNNGVGVQFSDSPRHMKKLVRETC